MTFDDLTSQNEKLYTADSIERVVDEKLQEKTGMTFDAITESENLHVIEDSAIDAIEEKLQNDFNQQLAEKYNVSVESIEEGNINILTDTDFTKLEEAFIAKIAESLDMTSTALTEKLDGYTPKGTKITESMNNSMGSSVLDSLIAKTGMVEHTEAKVLNDGEGSSLAESLIANTENDSAVALDEGLASKLV